MPDNVFRVSSADNAQLRAEIYLGSASFVQGQQASFLAGLLISVDLIIIEVSIENEKLLTVEAHFN